MPETATAPTTCGHQPSRATSTHLTAAKKAKAVPAARDTQGSDAPNNGENHHGRLRPPSVGMREGNAGSHLWTKHRTSLEKALSVAITTSGGTSAGVSLNHA
jgi:hypothetical protein